MALHAVPQLMPAGLLVTLPVPAPCLVTVSRCGDAVLDSEKLAAAVRACDMDTTQVGREPAQEPLQPANVEPAAGVAVSVTEVPVVKLALQLVPQLIPAGVLVTVPPPVPWRSTVSVWVVLVTALKVAVIDRACESVTVQVKE